MRKSVLTLVVFFIFLVQIKAQSVKFPEVRTHEKVLFPKPVNGHVTEINPPGFAWLPLDSAQIYKLIFTEPETGTTIYEFVIEDENVFSPQQIFNPGKYRWTIEAYNAKGELLARRRPYHLIIPKGLPELPFPKIDKLLATISTEHPRLIFRKEDLNNFRATLTTTRKEGWKAVKQMADASLSLSPPDPPPYGNIEDYNLRRLEYRKYFRYLRSFIDEGLHSLSVAYLMTKEKRYAVTAKRILFEIIKWNADSLTSSNRIGFDEPGLSFARCLHRAYDWLYDALTEEERTIVKQSCIERARDTFLRVAINRPFLKNPGSSHDGRLIGYLCEQASVLCGDAPDEEVKQWLEYSLKAFMTVFPHWGGKDGGWAEGIGYAATYNNKATHWIESCRSVLNLDLWQKPFFRKVKDYFLYCARPNDEFWPFGDGAERGPRNQPSRARILHILMRHYAQRFDDPTCQWWAEQVAIDPTNIEHPVMPLILPQKINAIKPSNLTNAKVFDGIGWCALHSDISDIDNDVFFLLKSSPYGSISHSHADQNAFYISIGGRALAIPSGYYGPVYGMPHHANWTRATKANNCVLVNNQGQVVRDFTAFGRITDFKHSGQVSYVSADATPAYKGLLERCHRHVVFVRPGLFVVLDDLEAPENSTFQWLLHSLERMNVDENRQAVHVKRKGVWLDVRLFNSSGLPLILSQTDQFDTPYWEGTPKDRKTNYAQVFMKKVPPQHHFKAATQIPETKLRIAVMMIAGSGKKVTKINWLDENGWKGASIQYPDGLAEVWAQLDEAADIPDALKNMTGKIAPETIVIGLWYPKNGESVEIQCGGQN